MAILLRAPSGVAGRGARKCRLCGLAPSAGRRYDAGAQADLLRLQACLDVTRDDDQIDGGVLGGAGDP